MYQPIDSSAKLSTRSHFLWPLRLSERGFAVMSLGVCLAFFSAFALTLYFRYTNDDAFIFFRYAANLAHGYGFAYNPGERVEGVTSLAWTLLLAPFALSNHLILASKLLGLACALVIFVAFYKTLHALTDDRLLVFVGLWMLALNQLFESWVFSGMDVALYLAWQTVFLYLVVTRDVTNTAQSRVVVWITGLGFLVRPDAYLVALIGWATWGLRSLDEIRKSRRTLMGFLGSLTLVSLLGALPFVFRLWYFGKLLPNTFYAKSFYTAVGGENRLGIQHGLAYLTDSINYVGWVFVWLAAAGLVLSSLQPRSRVWSLAITCLGLATYVTLIGGDVLTQRFFLSLVPTLIIGFVLALKTLLAKREGYVTPIMIPLLLGVVLLQSAYQYREAKREPISQLGHMYVKNNGIHTLEADYAAGLYLQARAEPADVLLTDNIGAVGYASKLRIVDAYGLVSPQIAEMIFQGRRSDQLLAALLDSQADWLLCNYTINPSGQKVYMFYIAGAGFDITQWLTDHEYHEVSTWESETWYRRALLQRN